MLFFLLQIQRFFMEISIKTILIFYVLNHNVKLLSIV